jgi:hypothetical protein
LALYGPHAVVGQNDMAALRSVLTWNVEDDDLQIGWIRRDAAQLSIYDTLSLLKVVLDDYI